MTEDGEREKKSRITAISRATISSGRLPGLHCPGLLFLPPSEPLAPPISPVSPGSPASPASPVFSLALSLHPLPPLERHCERACRKSSPIPPSPHLSPLFIYSFFLLSSIRLPSLISSSFSLLRPPFQHLFPSPLSLSLSPLLFLATSHCDFHSQILCSRTETTHSERAMVSLALVLVDPRSLFLPILFTSHVETTRERRAQGASSSFVVSCDREKGKKNLVSGEIHQEEYPPRKGSREPRRRGRRSFPYSRAFSRTWMERRGIEMRSSTYRAALHGASRFGKREEERDVSKFSSSSGI